MDRRHQDDLVGPKEDFDFDGQVLKLKGIRAKPKPYGGTRPVIMNAGASPTRAAFAIRNCDAFFTAGLAHLARRDRAAGRGRQGPRPRRRAASSASTRSASSPAGRRRRRPRTIITMPSSSNADWSAVDGILALKNITAQNTPARNFSSMRTGYAQGMGGLPIVGDPDHIAQPADRSQQGGPDAGSPFRSSIMSTSCRSSATRFCRGSSARACARSIDRDRARRADHSVVEPDGRGRDGAGFPGGGRGQCHTPAHDRNQSPCLRSASASHRRCGPGAHRRPLRRGRVSLHGQFDGGRQDRRGAESSRSWRRPARPVRPRRLPPSSGLSVHSVHGGSC